MWRLRLGRSACPPSSRPWLRVRQGELAEVRRSPAQSVMRLYRPSSAGVVRAIALSDHWRCVSTPRWARVSAKVTSTCHRRTKKATISVGCRVTSVLKNACGSLRSSGSRTRTHRIVAGVLPGRYQIAMSEVISSSLSFLWPYQAGMQIRCQTVAGCDRRVLSLGRGAPFCAGRPRLCRDRSGGFSKRLASNRNLLISVAR